MNIWIATIEIVAPIFGLIVLGAILKRLPLLEAKGWEAVDRLIYWVFFPALLFTAVARADPTGPGMAFMALGMVAAVLVMTIVMFATARLLDAPRAARSSLVMGGIRFNTFLGVALAEQFYGNYGITLAAICIATLVPTVNVISIWTLRSGAPGGGMAKSLWALARNPLILACAAGAVVNLTNMEPQAALMSGIDLLGQAALPLGLVAIGAGLSLKGLKQDHDLLVAGTVAKLLLLPAIGFVALYFTGLDKAALVVALMWLALPSAPSSYVMARTLGGNASLMAGLLTVQVLASAITLPLLFGLLERL